MKKFELSAEHKINWFGITMFRIKACVDFVTITGDEIHSGDLGGFVESERNLSQNDKAWVCGDAKVWGNAEVCGDAKVFSIKHIFCVTPIGKYGYSLTLFRTKHHEINISFEWGQCTIDGFKKLISEWDDETKDVALGAVEIAQKHIDLSGEE